jgi:hypothetical protein
MKTKILTQLFFVAIATISLCSCTSDSVDETKSLAIEIAPSIPKTPIDVSLEEINTKPKR